MGYTQLSKVLTTLCIAVLERHRGIGAPLTTRRLFWLLIVHVGVFLASVTDVSMMSRQGALLALVKVFVTAKCEVEWSAMCREQVRMYTHSAAEKPSPAVEVMALRDTMELTLPHATLCLLPLALAFEGKRALEVAGNMVSMSISRVRDQPQSLL